jgi:DNA-binding winged helix-turn-helix (wHTH) protein
MSEGAERARASIEEARASAADELTLQVEVSFVDVVLARQRSAARLDALADLARRTGIQRARIACEVAAGKSLLYPPRVEDGLGRVLLECCERSPLERVQRVLSAGLCGLVPWALGREPGRRIVLTETHIIAEDHGNVHAREVPSGPTLRLLLALRHGHLSRANLLNEVWGIARFVPTRHLPVLHTAISRLRASLGEREWIVTHDDGYSLVTGLEIITWDETPEGLISASAAPPPDDQERVRAFVLGNGPVSSAQVAESLKLSASTALRLLRRLADDGQVVKSGGGRGTRYGGA